MNETNRIQQRQEKLSSTMESEKKVKKKKNKQTKENMLDFASQESLVSTLA